MKVFNKNVVFIVKDNQLGSYYLDLGYFKESVEVGFDVTSSDNFVSVKIFKKSQDMINYMERYKDEYFDFSMVIDPMASDKVIDKYFKENS